MFCKKCGNDIGGDRFCQKCGFDSLSETAYSAGNRQSCNSGCGRKNEALALVLSLLIPGVGQLYVGKIAQGIILLIAYAVCVLTWWLLFTMLGAVVIWIYSMADAYSCAKEYNRVLASTGNPPW